MNDTKETGTLGLEHLSHSRIQSYLGCGLRWRFHYVDRLKPAFTPAALAFGIAFHEAVEEALAGLMVGAVPPLPDLVAVMAQSLNEQDRDTPIQFVDEGGKDGMLEMATRMLTTWTAWKRPEACVIGIEHQFTVNLAPGLPPLVGRIDIIEDHGDEGLWVVDIKTAKSRWSAREIDEHSGQLVLYREALKELAAELGKPVKLAYEVITKTKTPVVERYVIGRAPEAIERQVKVAGLVVRAVEAGVFIPQPGWACATCPWAGPCREW
ncbi:MAG: PD-(D/E)XK nuclease family protein [Candidatus Riflebacteria bacterium]|nr:PD-(D/E)XK nuclease family protein [Candidatus Riflebacteria bacterium]